MSARADGTYADAGLARPVVAHVPPRRGHDADDAKPAATGEDSAGQESGVSAESAASLSTLIRESTQGNVDSFGRLYDLYVARVYRYTAYLCGNRTESEDLTQEVFIHVWQKLRTFRGPQQAFLSWLLRLTHNYVVDYLRRRKRDVVLLSQLEQEPGSIENCHMDDALELTILGRQALAMLKCLPVQQRHVILLKFVEGLSNSEISQVTGQSEGAIRIAQMRALQTLRSALD